jgi:PAS domain S-box-containing protein
MRSYVFRGRVFGSSQRTWASRDLVIGKKGAVAVALLLTAAIFALRVADENVADVPLFLLVVPIALCAATFGIRGGLVSGLLGLALTLVWYLHAGGLIGPIGWLTRASALLLVGGLVGRFADQKRTLEGEVTRHRDISLDLIVTANFEGVFTKVNPACTQVLGYTAEELCARPFVEFVHPDDVEATEAEAARQIEAGEPVLRFANRYRHKEGGYRWLEWTSRPDSKARELIAVARDITIRKQAEDDLSHHQEQLEAAVLERTRELEDARLETLQRLALAAEYRDDDTYQHTERVAGTVALLGERLGLPETDVALLRQAAPLHDVGKLGISDSILLKPGKLTVAEFEQVKAHTTAGATILSGSRSDVLQLAEQIALSHHEWWDGNGYPARLRGDAIPLCGRLVAVADVFDALTHSRPYKEAWSVEDAVAEIVSLRGRQFDPAVVDAFETLDHHALTGLRLVPQRRDPSAGRLVA